jgi:pimeloyl-ACP methyl ester carboxylesterase
MPDFLKADGGRIHYDVSGTGSDPAFVLIEGLGAHLVAWRREFCEPLVEAGYHVVRLDNRDVGLSQRYPDGGYSISDLASDTHELIEHLQIGPAHIVGQSMGGMVAQHLSYEHPADVASLTLLYTTPSGSYVDRAKGVDSLRAAPKPRSRQDAIELHVASELVCASTSFSFDERWKRELGGLMWDRGWDPDGVVRQGQALFADRVDLDALRRVDVPVLIVHGTADRLIDHRASSQLHEAMPTSELWLVDGLGHDLPLELLPALTTRIIANAGRAQSDDRHEEPA